MWKLTIEDDEGATRELDLVRDGYTIGRDGTCDVFLPERNVSRRHARLERDAEGCWWLVDLGAPYGVFLNGHRVLKRAALSPGDMVQVGDHWLGLVDDEPETEGDRAGASSPRSSMPWDVRAEPDRLLVFGGPDDGSCVRLDAGPVLFGVGEGVTIHLPEGIAPEGVHALLRPLPQGHYELVRRSTTVALRVRLQLAERALLHDGDLVHFELLDKTEFMAMRFLAAQQVRHSTLTPFADTGEGAGLGRGHRLDPTTLPTLEAVKETLHNLPLWWRLEGESVWPRPAGYRAPPVRFTDVTSEPAPTPAPVSDVTTKPAPLVADVTVKAAAPRKREHRAPRWVAAAAMLALAGGAWTLGRAWSPSEAVPEGAERAAGASSGALVAIAAPPRAPTVANTAGEGRVAPEAAESAGASPMNASSAEPPTPSRPSTLAARPLGPQRGSAPSRRPEPDAPGAALPDRMRAMCRADAERIARGEASPEIVQLHRARCP